MNVDNKIFDFAYMMAFRDATMRNAFPRRVGEEDGDFHDRKEIHDYINAIMKIAGQDNQLEVLGIIKALCDEENTDCGFTFGNAQKLVNMTAKYMFLSTYGDEQKGELFGKCHFPMDGVMMEWVTKHCADYGLESVTFKVPWSKLKNDDESLAVYNTFQDYIDRIANKEDVSVIEVDFIFWDE